MMYSFADEAYLCSTRTQAAWLRNLCPGSCTVLTEELIACLCNQRAPHVLLLEVDYNYSGL
jgi:hypothetical protein